MYKKNLLILGIAVLAILISIHLSWNYLKANRVSVTEPDTETPLEKDTISYIEHKHLLIRIFGRDVKVGTYQLSVDSFEKSLLDDPYIKEVSYNQKRDKILFISEHGDSYKETLRTRIYVQDKSGTRYIISDMMNQSIKDVKISPDGVYVAYSLFDPYSNQNIIISSIEKHPVLRELKGINKELLRTDIGGYYHTIGWSADSKYLYAVYVNDAQSGWQEAGLYALDIESGVVSKIDNSKEIFVNAKLAPDAESLAYVPYDKASNTNAWHPFKPYTIKILEMKTGKKKSMLSSDETPFGTLFWSPDGTKIAYSISNTQEPDQHYGNSDGKIAILDIKTGTSQGLSNLSNFAGWINAELFATIEKIDNDKKTNMDDTNILKILSINSKQEKMVDNVTGLAGIQFIGTSF